VSELAEDLTVRGAPRRLTRQNSSVDGIAWTADGRSLIYSSGPYTKPYLWRMSVGGGQPERLELAGARANFPTISGASHTLAYMRGGGGADIWKFEASGPPQTFLSSTLDERNPQFSPDGTRIAFESNRLGKDSQLWMANADGTNRIPLNEGAKGVQGSPRWSPDSRSLVFDGQDEIGQQAVYVVNAAGGQPHRVASPGNLPSWSHDSKWIYFGVRRTDRSTSAIWRVPAAGGDAVQIADAGSVTYPNPLESPDGKTLYYKRAGAASAMLFAKPVGGGPEHQILDSFWPGEDHQYFPVADGIYYVARPDPKLPFAFELRFLNFTTGKHQTLHRFETRFGSGLSVSPDRKTILYSGVPMSAGADLMLIRNFR
jgi:Tol biopolymer transport system component